MKTQKVHLVMLLLAAFIIAGCTENSVSPTNSPTNVAGMTATSLNKKGPVVHSVEGSGLLSSFEGKNLGARYTAHEYSDSTFDGEYEINCANATGDPSFKSNGKVLKFKVYEKLLVKGTHKIAIFLGQEKTGSYAGCYDLFFAIDNGNPGQSLVPDQVNYYLMTLPTLDYSFLGKTIEQWYESDPNVIIDLLGTMDCERGNVVIK